MDINQLIREERELDIQSEIEEDILRQIEIEEEEGFYSLKGIPNYGE